MKVPVIILCGIVLLILLGKVIEQLSIKSKCKSKTEGNLIGMDDSFMSNGGAPGESQFYAIYYPIYEYIVDGIAYWAQLNKYNKNAAQFAKKVSVFYDPEDPEKCFINNVPGHIISRYNKEEYDKNNGGKNLTLDYKWRPSTIETEEVLYTLWDRPKRMARYAISSFSPWKSIKKRNDEQQP